MLPFLKKKYQGSQGVIIKMRPSDLPKDQQEGEDPALESAAQDVLDAIQAQDHKLLAKAMKAAFQVMELEPHDEIEHEEGQEE